MEWNAFNKYEALTDKYLPEEGEGTTRATQAVTAVCKLVYKWFNDGDVYDNRYFLCGWYNNLSTYANWLYRFTNQADMLKDIDTVRSENAYSDLLWELCEAVMKPEYLEQLDKEPKVGSIYTCKGPFVFEKPEDEEEGEDW